jgi:hypothetical protein
MSHVVCENVLKTDGALLKSVANHYEMARRILPPSSICFLLEHRTPKIGGSDEQA